MKLGEARKKLDKGGEVNSAGYGLMFKLSGDGQPDDEDEIDEENPMSILSYLKKMGCPKKRKGKGMEIEIEEEES